MRKILNISLPERISQEVSKKAKKRGFASTSEYIRFLLEQDDDLISADELLQMAKEAEAEYLSGKLENHSSLKEIM
jgi:Arc/MetJ-type ribon-helix-helix transcriptional regulator